MHAADTPAVDNASEDGVGKNRPKGTPFRQQKLAAWQPILTATTVIPAFLLVGVVFVPIGAILITVSGNVLEHAIDYTMCTANNESTKTNFNCSEVEPDSKCDCVPIEFTLDAAFAGDVYFYYGLANFYQNHRRYVRSRSDEQLRGDISSTSDCAPFTEWEDGNKKLPYAPCGAIASSIFNDSFALEYKDATGAYVPVPWTGEGIAWDVDKDSKFRNPDSLDAAFNDKSKPPESWNGHTALQLTDMLPGSSGVGFLNEDFMVWMRTAALPTFRKLYRKLTMSNQFASGLPKGDYRLNVVYQYPVAKFHGSKRFIISTTSALGAKNNFLGIAYTVVGALCLVMAGVFTVIHLKFGKSVISELNARPRTS